MSTKSNDSTAFDPSRRRLCPDGSCIGLIGSDGKCTVCGTLAPGGTGEKPAASPPALPTPEPESRGEPAGFASAARGGPSREAERSERGGEAGGGPKGVGTLPGFPREIETTSDAEEAFNPNRRLCPDEACIGVIGSDSKCSVCGRRG